MIELAEPDAAFRLLVEPEADDAARIRLIGRLDATSAAKAWDIALRACARKGLTLLTVDASGLDDCDGAGIALLIALRRQAAAHRAGFRIEGLAERFERYLSAFPAEEFDQPPAAHPKPSAIEEIGRDSHLLWRDVKTQIAFVGECATALALAFRHPSRMRWSDALLAAEQVGANALPIVGLIGFLLGLIMAFQAAIPMKMFGAELYVADLVGLSLIRELGPLITAIVLAGRTGSSFAAELGTMKVNEEIDALTTMGLEPVRFLAAPRILATVAMTPLLAIFANVFGLIGGLIVYLMLGFPVVTYVNEVTYIVDYVDMLGGLAKAMAFGLIVAGVGCQRGLQTGYGASAVGIATTRAVVAAIIWIAVADGLFAVLFYYLGI